MENERSYYARTCPRELLLTGSLIHRGAGPIEYFVERETGLLDLAHEIPGEQAIGGIGIIASHFPRTGRKRDEGAFSRIHLRQAPFHSALGAEWVIAAGIENDDFQPRSSALELLLDPGCRSRRMAHVGFIMAVEIDWDQILLAVNLHPVTGIV